MTLWTMLYAFLIRKVDYLRKNSVFTDSMNDEELIGKEYSKNDS